MNTPAGNPARVTAPIFTLCRDVRSRETAIVNGNTHAQCIEAVATYSTVAAPHFPCALPASKALLVLAGPPRATVPITLAIVEMRGATAPTDETVIACAPHQSTLDAYGMRHITIELPPLQVEGPIALEYRAMANGHVIARAFCAVTGEPTTATIH